MANLTFFSVLKSNIKCALCGKRNCRVKYHPDRKREYYFDGTRYVDRCPKDRDKKERKIIKEANKWRKLP